jgi:H+/Cl- antiporter ClcA
MFGYLSTFRIGMIVEKCGSGPVYLFFACVAVFAALFVYFVVPETKGKDMEEIQNLLSGNKNDK